VLRGVLADPVRGFPGLMITVRPGDHTGEWWPRVKAEGTRDAGYAGAIHPGEAPGYRSGGRFVTGGGMITEVTLLVPGPV